MRATGALAMAPHRFFFYSATPIRGNVSTADEVSHQPGQGTKPRSLMKVVGVVTDLRRHCPWEARCRSNAGTSPAVIVIRDNVAAPRNLASDVLKIARREAHDDARWSMKRSECFAYAKAGGETLNEPMLTPRPHGENRTFGGASRQEFLCPGLANPLDGIDTRVVAHITHIPGCFSRVRLHRQRLPLPRQRSQRGTVAHVLFHTRGKSVTRMGARTRMSRPIPSSQNRRRRCGSFGQARHHRASEDPAQKFAWCRRRSAGRCHNDRARGRTFYRATGA
ncbi:hypothetical protein PAN31108_00624 [Pandoraea anhela]|uniref:Uncharacterized protein n=1 Tax=Pandoraea anhela TaxID=2508295 RepID=A0A5E4S8R4_9BURK|nr:hypothetical protein PAN31108_00624 [Pandoraea anhela]